ncbi:MFS transporter [Streptomyces canus]|uniref:MFS transporter n=1 Tax=Streptomyces canus TaxID=58343 RepID=UPI0033DCABA9
MRAGYFLVLLDVTVVNVALPAIGSDLGTDVGGLGGTPSGGGSSTDTRWRSPPSCRPAARPGTGTATFGCGPALSVGVLVAARVVQGVGAALLLPGTLAIIGRAFPDDAARARAIGVWAGIGSLALPAGPLVGGALVDGLGRRAVFLINVPVVLLALLCSTAVVRENRKARARRLDLPGMVSGGVLLHATTYAFIEGGRSGAGSPEVLTAAAGAGADSAARSPDTDTPALMKVRAAPNAGERPGRCECAFSRTSFPIGGGARVSDALSRCSSPTP